MRILPIFLFIFSCATYGQELNNPNKLKLCPKNQTERFHNCWGTFTHPEGDKYVGEFKDDKFNGQATYYYLANNQFKGHKYVGEFKDGKKHGQGIYIAKGDKYVGEWKDDKKHGLGTYYAAKGDKYVGEWKDDKSHGQGTQTYADGRPIKEGIWAGDKFVRAEKINLPPVNQKTDVAINEGGKRLEEGKSRRTSVHKFNLLLKSKLFKPINDLFLLFI